MGHQLRLTTVLSYFIIIFTFISCDNNDLVNNKPEVHDISVSKTPASAGVVLPSADTTLEKNEELWLMAEPDDNYRFSHWSGAVDSVTDNPFSVTADKDYGLQANFVRKDYKLTTNTLGKGTINESIVENKSKEYNSGTVVELTAKPATGYTFVEWKGDISKATTNPVQITINEPKEVTGIFKKKKYSLTTHTEGEGAINEKVVQQKSTDFEYGTVIELTANPAIGYKFIKWKGDISGSENPLNITLEEPTEITAVFKKKSYDLTVLTSGKGTVSEKVISQKSTSYNHGTIVELNAEPATGWKLREWQGDLSGSEEVQQITIDEPKKITAVFDEGDYTAPLMDMYDVTDITTGPFSQALEYVDGQLLMFKASSSNHDKFDGVIQRIDPTDFSAIGDLTHNLGHSNNTSYDENNDILMMGSLPAFHGTEGEIYIFYNFSQQLKTKNDTLDYHTIPKKVVDISDALPDSEYGKTVASFGEDENGKRNIVYIGGGYSENWAKIRLGMGGNNLPNGSFESGLPANKYNGTYEVVWEKDYTIQDQNHFGVIQGTDWHRDLLFTADGHKGVFVSIWSGMKNGDPLQRDVLQSEIYDNDNNIAADTLISEGITQINGDIYMGVVIGDERYIGVFEL